MKIYHKYFSKYSNIIVIKIIKKNLKIEQSQGYGFSDSVMCRCELDGGECWVPNLMLLNCGARETRGGSLDHKEMNPIDAGGDQP